MYDLYFDPVNIDIDSLLEVKSKEFPTIDDKSGERMKEAIDNARRDLDSVGGIIECAAIGLPVGIGEPIFDGIENNIAKIVFGIPAV